jgi:hypothetical protein
MNTRLKVQSSKNKSITKIYLFIFLGYIVMYVIIFMFIRTLYQLDVMTLKFN